MWYVVYYTTNAKNVNNVIGRLSNKSKFDSIGCKQSYKNMQNLPIKFPNKKGLSLSPYLQLLQSKYLKIPP